MGSKSYDAPKVHVYYAWFAGVFNALQADELVALIVDSEEVWRPTTSIKRELSSNPYVADVSTYGRFHFYWGTSDQTLTPTHLAFMANHSNYRDRPLIFFEDWKCGRERTSIPNVELILRRNGVQSIVTGDAAALDEDGQGNPIVSLAEAWTHPIVGAGRSGSMIDTDSWQALADDLAENPDLEYLTVCESSETTLREVLSNILDHIDGFGYFLPSGKYALGRFLQEGAVPSDLPTITLDMMESEPEVDSVDMDTIPNMVEITFTNRDLSFKECSARYDNQYARRRAGGVVKKERVSRKYIRRYLQAQALAPKIGLTLSRFYHSGSFSIAAAVCPELIPGAIFLLDLPQYKINNELTRVMGRGGDDSDTETITIEFETELNLGTLPDAPEDENESIATLESVTDFAYWQPVLLPPSLTGSTYQLAALAGRTLGLTTAAKLWMRYGSVEQFYQLGEQRNFAYPVCLAADYAATEDLDDESGHLQIEKFTDPEPEGFDSIDTSQSDEAIQDNTLLMFVFDGTDTTLFEVFTIKSINSPTSGVYPVYAKRARFGTNRLSFSAGDTGYIINRSVIKGYGHSQFASIANETELADRQVSLKLQPASAYDLLELDDCTTKTFELTPQDLESVVASTSDII